MFTALAVMNDGHSGVLKGPGSETWVGVLERDIALHCHSCKDKNLCFTPFTHLSGGLSGCSQPLLG